VFDERRDAQQLATSAGAASRFETVVSAAGG